MVDERLPGNNHGAGMGRRMPGYTLNTTRHIKESPRLFVFLVELLKFLDFRKRFGERCKAGDELCDAVAIAVA